MKKRYFSGKFETIGKMTQVYGKFEMIEADGHIEYISVGDEVFAVNVDPIETVNGFLFRDCTCITDGDDNIVWAIQVRTTDGTADAIAVDYIDMEDVD